MDRPRWPGSITPRRLPDPTTWLLAAAFCLASLAACGSAPAPVCGDGKTEPPEVCDDGSENGTPGHCNATCTAILPAQVSVEGDVFAFMNEVSGPRVAGATISVLEQPSKTATTGADGHFEIDGLDVGSQVTLVMSDSSFYPTQSATYTLGSDGIRPFAFQVLSNALFTLLSGLFAGLDQTSNCTLATTVTRLGGTVHVDARQGEAGAQLTLSPRPAGVEGPVYFSTNVIPDTTLTATTVDGGGLFYNVPPGDYVVSATKAGFTFAPVKMTCRAGYLVNAGPPIGLQSSVASPDWGAGAGYPSDAYTTFTDAMCTQTASCTNAQNGAGAYPAATVSGCQQTFRRVLSFVDATCDATAHVRDTLKAFFDCKAATCTLALGGDTACPTEEQAYVNALEQYAPCYTAAHGQ